MAQRSPLHRNLRGAATPAYRGAAANACAPSIRVGVASHAKLARTASPASRWRPQRGRLGGVHADQRAVMPELLKGRTADPATWMRTPGNLARLATFKRETDAHRFAVAARPQCVRPAAAASSASRRQHEHPGPDQGEARIPSADGRGRQGAGPVRPDTKRITRTTRQHAAEVNGLEVKGGASAQGLGVTTQGKRARMRWQGCLAGDVVCAVLCRHMLSVCHRMVDRIPMLRKRAFCWSGNNNCPVL
ncbi:hypothetical protein AQF52_0268 [Streptomyces venezuelae]|nr:hypothetical protein AQF52_0268 [Streptomyces venezuelae]